MKKSAKRILYLFLFAIIATVAAMTVAVASRTSPYDGKLSAASAPDAQMTELATTNGGIKQIALGNYHTIILFENGEVYGTGSNSHSQLGFDDNEPRTTFERIPFLSGKGITFISCGQYHTMALSSDGTVYGTGNNSSGQLGLGDKINRDTFEPIPSLSGKNITFVECGYYHTMALSSDGTVYGTGNNSSGQLGLGDTIDRNTFEPVFALSGKNITSVESGDYYTIAIGTNKNTYVTGAHVYGQLVSSRIVATSVNVFTYIENKLDYVVCGSEHTVYRSNNIVYHAGSNKYGQLGISTDTNKYYSTVLPIPNIALVACGGNHTMLMTKDGEIYGSGNNESGQLGRGGFSTNYTSFGLVQSLTGKNIKTIMAKYNHTVALSADGTVYSTGSNSDGRLGVGDRENKSSFTKVPLDYTINFDANGGHSFTNSSVTTTTQKLPYHINTPLTENLFKHGGDKVFVGWSSTPDGEVEYTDKEEVVFLADINTTKTLYAVWKTPESTVKADLTNITYHEGEINLSFDHTAYAGLNYTYQWYKDGQAVDGATNATLTLTDANESGAYKLKITAEFAYDSGQTQSASAFSSNEVAIVINKATLSPTVNLSDKEYDGTPVAPEVIGNIGGGEVTFIYKRKNTAGGYDVLSAAPTDAGEYTLSIRIAETDNTHAYETPAGGELHFSILPSTASPTVQFGKDYVYNGEAIAAPVVSGVTEDREITIMYIGTTTDGREYSSDVPPTEAGSYSVAITVAGSANYAANYISIGFTIAQKTLDELAVSLQGWKYGQAGETPAVTGNDGNEVVLSYMKKNAAGVYEPYAGEITTAGIGEYKVIATVNENNNYEGATAEAAFTITKGVQDPTVNIGDFTYGDNFVLKLGNICEDGEVTLAYSDASNDGTSVSGTTMPESAGDYVLTVTVGATENYEAFSKEYNFTIKRKTVYAPYFADKLFTNGLLTADVEMTDAQARLFTVTENNGGTALGKYPVKLQLKDANNYEWAADLEITGGNKAEATVYFNIVVGMSENSWTDAPDIVNKEGLVYGGEAVVVNMGVAKYGEVTVTYKTAAGEVLGNVAPTDAGSYVAVFDVAEKTAEYMGLHMEVPFTIAQRNIKIRIENKEVVYGEAAAELTYAVTDGDVLEGDDLDITLTRQTGRSAGTYVITGACGNGNYAAEFVNGAYNILKADYDMSQIVFKDTEITYDGNAHRLEVSGKLVGKDGVEVTVNYTYSIDGKESLTNVSEGALTVTATFETASSNYNVPGSMMATLKIVPKQLTAEMFTVAEGLYVYNGEAHKPGISIASTESTLTESDYGDITYGANINAGEGTIIVKGMGNYVGEATIVFAIAKADITPTVTIEGWKYGQQANAPEVSGNAGNGACEFRYAGTSNGGVTYASSLAPTRAGNYTVTVTVAETDNYNAGTASFDFTIVRTGNILEVEVRDWTYGETANAPIVTGNNDKGEEKYLYKGTANDGTTYESSVAPVKAGTYTLSVTIEQTDNYLFMSNRATFTIRKQTVTAPEILPKVYDNGYKLTADVTGNDYYTVTKNEGGAEKGSYNVVLTLKDPYNYAWDATAGLISGDNDEIVKLAFRIIGYANEWNKAPSVENVEYGEAVNPLYEAAYGNETVTVVYRTAGGQVLSEAPTALGNYTVTLTLTETIDYTGLEAVLEFSILPKQVTVTIDDKTSVYGEAFAAPTFTVSELAYGETKDVLNLRFTKEAGANVGTYAISGTWDNGNYAVTFVGGTYTVTKATYDMSGVKFENKTVTYDKEKHSLTLTGELPAGVSVEYVNNGKTAAGTYEVIAKFSVADAENYNALTANELKATLTIEKATYDMSYVKFADETVTYDDEIHSLAVTGLPEGVSVAYEGNGKKNAGTYEVIAKFSVADTENYNALVSNELTATLTIKKAIYDVSNMKFADETITYDGEIHSLTVTGLPAGVSVEYTGNGKKNAGTYEITAKFTGDANYESIGDMTATLTIGKATYDMSSVKFEDETITYDGEIHSLAVTGLPAGVSVEYVGNGKRNACTYEVTAKFFVADAENYEPLTSDELKATLTIEKATYDVTNVKFDDATVTYDGETHSLTVTGLPVGVSVEYVGNGKKNAGTYEVTARFTGDANYEAIEDMTATLTIDKAVYDMSNVKFASETVTYDGETHSLAVTGLPAGVRVEYIGNGKKNAGTYEVTARFTGDANYETIEDMTATLTVKKAVYDMSGVKFESGSFEYDGATHSLTLTGKLPTGVRVEYVGNDKSKTGTYEVTVKFTGDANYEAIPDMTATLTIVEKGGCAGMVADGFTVAGISLAALICAAIALRKAKLNKRKNK